MTEYTRCPRGVECRSLVKIWGSTNISFCCHPCWQTFWEEHDPSHEGETHDYGHSEQCDSRQTVRAHLDIKPVTDRLFVLTGKVPDEIRNQTQVR